RLTYHVSHLRLRLANQRDYLFRSIGRHQVLAQFRVANQAADTGEDGQVLRDGGCDQEEKKSGRLGINGSVTDSLVVPAKDNDRLFDQADQRVARVGQGHAVTHAGAVELFAFLQRAEQGLPGIGPLGDFWDARDEFAEHVIALAA